MLLRLSRLTSLEDGQTVRIRFMIKLEINNLKDRERRAGIQVLINRRNLANLLSFLLFWIFSKQEGVHAHGEIERLGKDGERESERANK